MRSFLVTSVAWLLALLPFPGITASPAYEVNPPDSSFILVTQEAVDKRSSAALLNIPIQYQLPELYNGCEVTSLAMLLAAKGYDADKMELAARIKKDDTPFKGRYPELIEEWGDPNKGFVGDISGKQIGYGVYNGPIFELLQQFSPHEAVNLSGYPFSFLEWAMDQGSPVVAWTTVDYRPTNQWVTWKNGDQTIKATFKEHAVLLVGYDQDHVYINDPLIGAKGKKVPKEHFIASWEQLGAQAVTILEKETSTFAAKLYDNDK